MSYLKIEDKRTVFIDVDQTLIFWAGDEQYNQDNSLLLDNPTTKECFAVSPIQEHIQLISELRTVGWKIVVWSQGGSDHAERVVKLLKIEELVDLIVSKPQAIVDDLAFEHQHIKRIYKV